MAFMERRSINPWNWQQGRFDHAVETTAAERVLWCAGQTAVDADGNVVGEDMATQVTVALDNLEAVLTEAGMSLRDVVRVTWYVTSIERFREAAPSYRDRLVGAGFHAASTLVQVAALAFPGLQVEITATAVA
jgi:enamine deaminase RidA (YjgF/YER057c/UK114 family)